ncbi:MAG: hypothetical protein MUF48_08295 [Pirellulaceae bacterium]|jgi:hypothetical protein|nr:hypothetical protein [Pirellulaceae bacterium]
MDDLPKAVEKTLRLESGDGEVREIVKKRERTLVVYEAQVGISDLGYAIRIAGGGRLLRKVLVKEASDQTKVHNEDGSTVERER